MVTQKYKKVHHYWFNRYSFEKGILLSSNRNYAELNLCMNEFRCARAHATGSNKRKFLIPVLYGDISVEDVNDELKFYLENHTYLEYSEWVREHTATCFQIIFFVTFSFVIFSFQCIILLGSILSFQDMMKGRLKVAMPDVPLQVLREQRETHETQDIESNDGQEHIYENNQVDPNCELEDRGGAAAVNDNDENDATFQCEAEGNDIVKPQSRITQLKHVFKRARFGLKRSNIYNTANGTLDITAEEEHGVRYGDNVESDGENEGEFREEIPLVKTRMNSL